MQWLLAAVTAATVTMGLQSGDFTPGSTIPTRAMALDCGGKNRSPQLAWSGAPAGTKSFALILRDPDAQLPGGFYHWVVYNLGPNTHALAAGATLGAAQLGETSAGRAGYYGPCPPPGPAHHYIFTLYALDVAHIAASTPLTAGELQRRIAAHVLARATLDGVESHH